MKKLLVLLFLFSSLFACSSSKNSSLNSGRIEAIDVITQTLNMNKQETLKALNDSFRAHDLEIASIEQGKISTFPKNIVDTACHSSTPASCEVSFRAFIKQTQQETEELKAASEVKITYTEDCLELSLTNIKCRGSNAEKLMISIIDKVKTSS